MLQCLVRTDDTIRRGGRRWGKRRVKVRAAAPLGFEREPASGGGAAAQVRRGGDERHRADVLDGVARPVAASAASAASERAALEAAEEGERAERCRVPPKWYGVRPHRLGPLKHLARRADARSQPASFRHRREWTARASGRRRRRPASDRRAHAASSWWSVPHERQTEVVVQL